MSDVTAVTMRELANKAIKAKHEANVEHAQKVLLSIMDRIHARAESGYFEYESYDLQLCNTDQRLLILGMLEKRGFRAVILGHNHVQPVYTISWNDENAC